MFQIDSDEYMEQGLREEILKVVENADEKIQALKIPRKNLVYGKWCRYARLYPDYQTRVFRRNFGRFEDREVDAHLHVSGNVVTLKHNLIHDDFKSIASWIQKFERYTRYDRDQLIKENRRFSVVQITIFPFIVFIRNYFWRKGFLDGFRGFQMAVFSSFYYFVRYLRLWEHGHAKKNSIRH